MPALYLDCPAGAAGDMILAALLDCGLSPALLQEKLKLLPLDGYHFNVATVHKNGLRALQVQINCTEKQPRRNLTTITELLHKATLTPFVREKSLAVFQALARAEARIHNLPLEEIHFHELGAVDSIIDIVGSLLALEMLGVETLSASPLPLGRGWQNTAHGSVPLPAPATLEIIREFNIPCYGLPLEGETVTPTGAALLAVTCSAFSPSPSMRIGHIGYGAGQKDFPHPNILRAWQGTLIDGAVAATGQAQAGERDGDLFAAPLEIIEANIDDLNPEIYEYLLERLFAGGALDVYFSPIQMKKNRPAVKVTILADPQKSHLLGQILLQETTTIGYRRQPAEKIMLRRGERYVDTPWGKVKIKVAGSHPHYYNIAPEYADCVRIAREKGIPLKKIYQYVGSLFHA
ncbi:MAG: nickel pincer cofactor biosynthesis protein LarC [Bacillota bacterium]